MVAAALGPLVTIGEGEPPITVSVESDGARLLVQSKTYRELRTAEVPTSFQWSLALFLALVFAALPGYPFARRLLPAAVGVAVLFALHVAFAFTVIRVNTVANMGDISRVRFTDGSRAVWPVAHNFLKFAIDWVPIAAWFVPFARSGSLLRLLGSKAP